MPPSPALETPGCLGIEAGGTRTTAAWLPLGSTVARLETFGPANLQLVSDLELTRLLASIARLFPTPIGVGIGMAGLRTAADRDRLLRTADALWPAIPTVATNDLEIALAADRLDLPFGEPSPPAVLVLSGTGSCCYGRGSRGRVAKVGGWGHILGDQGSGYAIVLQAIRRGLERFDQSGAWGPLGRRLLRARQLNEPDALIPWARGADKSEIAGLAPEVFEAAREGDPSARAAIAEAAAQLANAALACARRLAPNRSAVRFVLAGGVLLHQPGFARRLARCLRQHRPRARISVLRRSGAEGAAFLARPTGVHPPQALGRPTVVVRTPARDSAATGPDHVIPRSTGLSPTEERNPRSGNLDRLPLSQAIDLMLDEDRRLPAALRAEKESIARAIRLITRALRTGGRLFYVGAGTSGRLGILDASECPPTFRTPPDLVQGIIAGGASAVFQAVEGGEDDFEAGARSIALRDVRSRDVVVGIAASGRTPFVWGALGEAARRRARNILVCFNPRLEFRRGHRPTVVIAPRVGPEILTGSTRLKAGTATKMILNLFTTLAMVGLGKVIGNLMVDLNPTNRKLRERAVRITCELTGTDPDSARAALERAGWQVKRAVLASRARRRND